MSDVTLADTCACGSDHWHRLAGPASEVKISPRNVTSSGQMAGSRFIYCGRCGSIRFIFDTRWQIPLDRAGDVARSVVVLDEEPPTDPGTPNARKKKGDGE